MTVQKIESTELVELERLSNKILLLKHALGGLLPGLTDTEITCTHTVLEIGCGPGSWSLDMAQTYYSHMEVTGIDPSFLMVSHANIQAIVQHLDNVRFLQVPDLVGPFPFANDSFNLISMQFLSKALYRNDWRPLISECWRLLQPGGWLRVTDFEVPESNAPFHKTLWSLFVDAMRLSGRYCTPHGHRLEFIRELEPMLTTAGFHTTFSLNHMIDYSSGAPLHEEWKRDFFILLKDIFPRLVTLGVVSQDSADLLYLQQQREMNLCSFQAQLPLMTVWGQKRYSLDAAKVQ